MWSLSQRSSDQCCPPDPDALQGGCGKAPAFVGDTPERTRFGYLAERELWLIRLRWIAIVGVVTVVGIATALGWLELPVALFGVAGSMVVYNLVFWRAHRLHAREVHELGQQERWTIGLQVLCDLCALTMLLHWSGGMQNPFWIFFAFHMAIAAMLLPLRHSLALGVAAFVLFGGTVTAEYLGFFPHHPLLLERSYGGGSAWQSGPVVAGFLLAFMLGLFGVIYFVRSVEIQRRSAQMVAHERERVAEAHERMARIGEISAGVSHSVRNPLHGLMNCVDLLRSHRCNGAEPQTEILELMTDGLKRIESVTSRLLTLTRDEELQKSPTNINALLQDSIRFVDTRLQEPDVQLGELPLALVDPNRISEAVINLLDNAARACRLGGRVSVRSAWLPESEQICVRIVDTGEGITPEKLAHIFDPFFTTRLNGEGSGLGLAIARSVIEEHGGEIQAHSTLGAGTTITLLLPATKSRISRRQDPTSR